MKKIDKYHKILLDTKNIIDLDFAQLHFNKNFTNTTDGKGSFNKVKNVSISIPYATVSRPINYTVPLSTDSTDSINGSKEITPDTSKKPDKVNTDKMQDEYFHITPEIAKDFINTTTDDNCGVNILLESENVQQPDSNIINRTTTIIEYSDDAEEEDNEIVLDDNEIECTSIQSEALDLLIEDVLNFKEPEFNGRVVNSNMVSNALYEYGLAGSYLTMTKVNENADIIVENLTHESNNNEQEVSNTVNIEETPAELESAEIYDIVEQFTKLSSRKSSVDILDSFIRTRIPEPETRPETPQTNQLQLFPPKPSARNTTPRYFRRNDNKNVSKKCVSSRNMIMENIKQVKMISKRNAAAKSAKQNVGKVPSKKTVIGKESKNEMKKSEEPTPDQEKSILASFVKAELASMLDLNTDSTDEKKKPEKLTVNMWRRLKLSGQSKPMIRPQKISK